MARLLLNNSSKRRIAFGAFGIALSCLGLWFVFRGINVDELLASSHRIKLLPLFASVAIQWGGLVVFRSVLVRYLLRPIGVVPLQKIYSYICIGFLANNVLPLRMGEGARVVGIARCAGLSIAAVAGGLAVERLLDMTMVVLLGVIAAQFVPVPDAFQMAALIVGCGVLVGFGVLVFIARRDWNSRPQEPERLLRITLWNLVVRFVSGFKALGTSRSMLLALVYSAVVWLFIISSIQARLVAFDLPFNLPMVLVLLAFLGLGVALPSAPAYTGIYQVAAVLALHNVFHIEKEIALGFAFFSWCVDIVTSSLAGAICLFVEGLSLSDLRVGTSGIASAPNLSATDSKSD